MTTTTPPTSIIGNGFWALLSGALGAAASCFAKFAFSSHGSTGNEVTEATWMSPSLSYNNNAAAPTCPSLDEWKTCLRDTNCAFSWLYCHLIPFLLPRLVCVIAMLLCNAAMVACFVGGLQDAGSIAGTALATAANFIVSAAAGYFIWKEGGNLSVPGLGMVIVGTILLVLAQAPPEESGKSITNHKEEKTVANIVTD